MSIITYTKTQSSIRYQFTQLMTNSVYLESSIKIRGHTFIHWLIYKKWELILKYFLKVLTQHFWLLMFLMTTNIINFYVDVCTGYPQKMFLDLHFFVHVPHVKQSMLRVLVFLLVELLLYWHDAIGVQGVAIKMKGMKQTVL